MRRMVFLASWPLKGMVATPFSSSQLKAFCGRDATRGSDAIQIMNGIKVSFAPAEDFTSAASAGTMVRGTALERLAFGMAREYPRGARVARK